MEMNAHGIKLYKREVKLKQQTIIITRWSVKATLSLLKEEQENTMHRVFLKMCPNGQMTLKNRWKQIAIFFHELLVNLFS